MGVVIVLLAVLVTLQQSSGQTTDQGEEEPVIQAVGVPLERQLLELDAAGGPLEGELPEQASGETASESCRSSTRERLVCFQEAGASQLDQIQANLTKLQGTVAQQDTRIDELTARLNLLEQAAGNVNLAIGKTATQSSDYIHHGDAMGPGKAVDGSRATDIGQEKACTHTKRDFQPWWKVDLSRVYTVHRVSILNRGDCCGERLKNFTVRVGPNEDFAQNNQCGATYTDTPTDGQTIEVYCNPPISGRYVSIQLMGRKDFLSLCEVEVYGETGHKPASCSEAKSLHPHADDGEYTLYPFPSNRAVSLRVYCHDMASGSPKEFLSLPSGPDENYAIVYSDRLVDASQWQCTGGLQDPYADRAGTTKFSKLRIQFDASRIEVIRDDYTFAQTTGPNDVDYGHAGDCYSANQECAKGTFKVDLTGTELALAPEVHWVMEERYPESLTISDMFISNNRKVASARCGGWCGHCWPAGKNMFLVHPQTSCPQNKSLVLPSGKTYFAAEGTGTYSGAQEECRRRGGIVAIPRNEEEQRNLVFLKNCVSSCDQFWLGVKKTAGEWVDGKGAALSNFTSWARGEPDDFDNGYSCAHIVFGDREGERHDNWADAFCNSQWRYVCEIDGAPKKWREDGQCGQGYPAEDGTPAECDPSGIYPCCSPANWCGNTSDHCDCPDCVDYRKPLPAPGKKWREDGQCGQGYPAEDGAPAECDPSGIYPCCSPHNWCGNTSDHCDCPDCVDYRKPLPELCQVGNGTSYRGQVSMTETGKTCQRWDSQSPHEHEYIPADHPSSGLEGNYCRNPSNWGEVWCYTTDPGTRWERCDVPTCGNHSLVVKTSATTDSQSGDFLTIEIFSADCEDVCATATVYGLTSTGTEYKRNFDASNFGVPTRLRLTASGKDWLKLDWVDVFNAYTGRSHRFPCPTDGCQLSTDISEGSEHLVLDLNEIHGLKIKTSAAADSQSADPLTIEILSADCEDMCTAVAVSGLARAGTEYNRTFAASNFGDPTRVRLTASGEDWLKLDWVHVYNAHTERSYYFSCPSSGCQLSTDTSEGSEQIELDVDVCPSGYVPFQDGERCFKFSAGKRNYTEARSACRAAGGHLALPKDQAANDFLVNQTNDKYPSGSKVWFGLTDQVEEGTFVWEDGTPLTGWNDWAPEQPDDYNSVEDCAEWRHEYGYKWNDVPCTTSRYYVCELGSAAP